MGISLPGDIYDIDCGSMKRAEATAIIHTQLTALFSRLPAALQHFSVRFVDPA